MTAHAALTVALWATLALLWITAAASPYQTWHRRKADLRMAVLLTRTEQLAGQLAGQLEAKQAAGERPD